VPDLQVNGRTYSVDEDGFLQDAELWNEEVAKDFASTDNITELTPEHWKVINYIRNYYQSYGIAPMVRKLCKETGCNLDKIYQLFPSGPAKGACKVAGLPKPAGCV
jgi:TusE/DsrC/DsvC family sulfur relay protein